MWRKFLCLVVIFCFASWQCLWRVFDALNVERGACQSHVMVFEIEICSRVLRRWSWESMSGFKLTGLTDRCCIKNRIRRSTEKFEFERVYWYVSVLVYLFSSRDAKWAYVGRLFQWMIAWGRWIFTQAQVDQSRGFDWRWSEAEPRIGVDLHSWKCWGRKWD